MALHFYKKHALNNRLVFKGATVGFEPSGNNEGIAILDDEKTPELVRFMEESADKRRGGVVRISPEVYDGIKKNLRPSVPSRNQPGVLSKIRLHNPESLVPKSNDRPKSAAESAGAVLPPPQPSSPNPGLVPLQPRIPQVQGAPPAAPVPPAAPPAPFVPKRARKSEVAAKVEAGPKQGA
jgi:hypothetical protein